MPTLPASLTHLLQQVLPTFSSPEEEIRFRDNRHRMVIERLEIYAPVAIVFVVLSALGHIVLFPGHVWLPNVVLLTLLMFTPLCISWWILHRASPQKIYWSMLTTTASVMLCVCLIVAAARQQGFPLPYEGILLVTLAVFLLSGLSARDASLCALIGPIGILIIEWFWFTSLENALIRPAFGVGAWMMGAIFSFALERTEYREFLYREALETMAHQDVLTGLLNRRGLQERFEIIAATALREQRPLSVAVLDLDYFKAYNDTYGHQQGDSVLEAVGRTIAGFAKRPLDAAGRIGGEEFLIVWYDTDAPTGYMMAESVRADIQALAIEHRGSPVSQAVTISIGLITSTMHEPETLESLYRQADKLLYQAKQQGRNQVVT